MLTQKGNYYVYITTKQGKTVLYTGVTNNLKRRLHEYYINRGDKKHFATRYYCYKLFHYEHFADINQAIRREKEMKNMSRKRKRN
jgi:putative endonuclease